MDVRLISCVCCMLCRQWSLRLADQSFTGVRPGVCLIVCDLETATIRRPRFELGFWATERRNSPTLSLSGTNLSYFAQDDVLPLRYWQGTYKSGEQVVVLVVIHLQLKDLETDTRVTERQGWWRATSLTRMDESEEVVTVRLLPSFISKTAEHKSNKLGPAPSILHRIIAIW